MKYKIDPASFGTDEAGKEDLTHQTFVPLFLSFGRVKMEIPIVLLFNWDVSGKGLMKIRSGKQKIFLYSEINIVYFI